MNKYFHGNLVINYAIFAFVIQILFESSLANVINNDIVTNTLYTSIGLVSASLIIQTITVLLKVKNEELKQSFIRNIFYVTSTSFVFVLTWIVLSKYSQLYVMTSVFACAFSAYCIINSLVMFKNNIVLFYKS